MLANGLHAREARCARQYARQYQHARKLQPPPSLRPRSPKRQKGTPAESGDWKIARPSGPNTTAAGRPGCEALPAKRLSFEEPRDEESLSDRTRTCGADAHVRRLLSVLHQLDPTTNDGARRAHTIVGVWVAHKNLECPIQSRSVPLRLSGSAHRRRHEVFPNKKPRSPEGSMRSR